MQGKGQSGTSVSDSSTKRSLRGSLSACAIRTNSAWTMARDAHVTS